MATRGAAPCCSAEGMARARVLHARTRCLQRLAGAVGTHPRVMQPCRMQTRVQAPTPNSSPAPTCRCSSSKSCSAPASAHSAGRLPAAMPGRTQVACLAGRQLAGAMAACADCRAMRTPCLPTGVCIRPCMPAHRSVGCPVGWPRAGAAGWCWGPILFGMQLAPFPQLMAG